MAAGVVRPVPADEHPAVVAQLAIDGAAWKAALSGLASAFVLAVLLYGMPVQLAVISALYGAAYGIFPIAWIVFASIMLYRLAVETGKFEIIKDSVGSLTDDRRLQAMFIAFSFGAFFEGASGFGTPVAITGAVPKKKDNPAVPVTPAEQVESTHEAFEAGASLVQLYTALMARTEGETVGFKIGLTSARMLAS